jgi:hypothetical protein
MFALAAALTLAACSDETYPDIESKITMEGDTLACDSAAEESGAPDGGPYLQYYCTFECIAVDGEHNSEAVAYFARDSVSDPWRLAHVFTSPGECE